ncbi:MAG: GerW family sporulation protein [Oscillospiraceae bacterium]|nr:GerW family sporulation protein [Oscillospiraceae bacterium]
MSQLLNIFEFTTNQIRALAQEQSVADEPIVIGDVTLVPISKLSCGFSCGGSDLAQKKKADGLMAGAGAKVNKTPLSFLAVRNGEVQLLSVSEEEVKKKGIMEAVKPILETLKERSAAKKAAKAEAKAEAQSAKAEAEAAVDAEVAKAIAQID